VNVQTNSTQHFNPREEHENQHKPIRALGVSDPQNEGFSEKGVSWALVAQASRKTTPRNLARLFKPAKSRTRIFQLAALSLPDGSGVGQFARGREMIADGKRNSPPP